MVRKYRIDQDAFAEIDTERKAYCLGFLLADGWVLTKGRGVSVAVGDADALVLDYIRECCGSDAPLFRKVRKNGHNSGGTLVGVNLCSMKMVADLARLGVVPNKSASTFLPHIRSDLTRHLLRGLFDGDGSIGPRQFWLVGSADILDGVVRLGRRVKVDFKVGLGNGYPRLAGHRRDAEFLKWLYEDCEFALPRKLARYVEHWKCSGTRGGSILSSPSSR